MSPVAKTLVQSATGIAAAAGLTYLFDPDSGTRRRQAVRDQCAGAAKRVAEEARVARYDLSDRLNRVAARVKAPLARADLGNEAVTRRVRVALWRAVPHPGTIKIAAHDGHVILYGDVVAAEREHAVRIARSIEGVREVSDHLNESTRGLEGVRGFARVKEHTLSIRQFPLLQETWSPSTRVLCGLTAGGLLAWAATHRNPIGALSAIAGSVLMLRSGTNVPLKRMVRGKRRQIAIHKVMEVKGSVAQVYERLAGYQNFPVFMRCARSMKPINGGKSHWTLAGPGGASYEWDVQTTLNEPNEVLAWRTVGDTVIQHTGIIRFTPLGSALTRLVIDLTYGTSGRTRGEVLAELLGSDPKREVEADLARLRMFLETSPLAPGSAVRFGTAASTGREPSSSAEGRANIGRPGG